MRKRFLPLLLLLILNLTACGKAHIDEEADGTMEGAEVKAATRSREEDSDVAWKEAYKKYLTGIIDGKNLLVDLSEPCTYNENGDVAYFTLQDITGDDIPELWITGRDPSEVVDNCFEVLTVGSKNKVKDIVDSLTCYYDPTEKELYTHSDTEESTFTVYENIEGRYSKKFSLVYSEDGRYSQVFGDGLAKSITNEEGEDMSAKFFDDRAKYSLKDLTKLTNESIEEAFME
ncbi:MAG: hypothetical protein J5802_14365 [Butyrivibrio sp.]|nr:hypothetical protein [Butyrivibrio sp.]